MSQSTNKTASIVLSVVLLAPTIGILLTSTALAQGEDIRVLAVYSSFAAMPTDSYFSSHAMAPGYRFASIPAIMLSGTAASVDGLRSHAALSQIVHDGPIQFHLETAVVASKARDVWGTAWHANSGVAPILKDGQPIDGRGVTVGVVDSGANALHPDLWYAPAAVPGGPLQPKIVACVHTTGIAKGIVGPVTVPTPNCDENVGHGTHVAGIVAGNGMMGDMGFTVSGVADYNGAAPGAQLAVAGLGVETIALGGLVIDGLAGLDWQYANADLLGIRVVTNSWSSALGCTGNWNNDADVYHTITNKLVQDKGITVLWAANNDGGSRPIGTSPQARNTMPGVINVANYNDLGTGTRDGDITLSSGDGCVTTGGSPTNMIWTWPDVAAPGTNIVSTAAGIDGAIGMAPVFVGSTPNDAPFYTTLTGTSMATPHVAGVAALLYQAYPAITPAQVERILIETAKPWADGVTARGVAGTTPYWGPGTSNNQIAGFTDKSACQITPAIAARAEANDASLDATYPGFRQMAQPRIVNGLVVDIDANLYVCRDFKRGHGLVDAEAAVRAALKLAGDGNETGLPEVKFTAPDAGATISQAQTTISGLVDRLGAGPNMAPTAVLAASATSGPAPLGVDFSLGGTDSDGVIANFTLAFGDGSAPLSGSILPTAAVHHDYTTTGAFTATLTVTDDEGAQGTSTVSINVGGLPVPDGTITGEAFAYNAPPANVGASNVAALVTANAGDGVPKYPPGADVYIAVRNGVSTDANVPIDVSTPGRFVIFKADGTTAAGPLSMVPGPDTDPVTSEVTVRWTVGQFTIPATWSGRYYFAPIVTVDGQDHIIQSQTFVAAPHFGLKPIDVIGPDTVGVPGLPGTTPGSDEGHSIGDADDDGAGPMGEIQWADTSVDSSFVTAVIKLGAVPVQPAGDSAFVYEFFINGLRIESYLLGTAPSLFDVTNGAVVTGGSTTWDTTANTVTIKVPIEYLNTVGVSAPYTGHVEAMVGEGLAAGVLTVDRAPNAGERTLAAVWQQDLPTLRLSSASDPDNTDPAGDSTGGLPHLDVTKVWISRESATEVDITLQVADLASSPPAVDAGIAKAATSYGAEFCVDNAAQTFTATSGNYAALSGVTCYRVGASNGALGVAHDGAVIQKDGSGSCGMAGISKGVVFNTAASTITWTVTLSGLNVDTTGAAVANCNTAPPTRTAPALEAGNKITRLFGKSGMAAGAGVVLTLSTDTMDANSARAYTLGGTAPALIANAGVDVSGLVGSSLAIAGSAMGGSAPYTCSWSASGGVFANAAACSTSVSFTTSGVHTLTLTVTDSVGATAVDTATATVTSPSVERVDVVIGGIVTASAPVDTSSASTDTWDVVVDLSGLPEGETDMVATWYEASGAQLATSTRRVNIQLDGVTAFIEILSPDADATVEGQSVVRGTAGHTAGAGSGGLRTNHYGLPIWSGQNGGRAAVTLEGFIEAPCATCAPGQLSKPQNQVPNAAWNPIANNAGPLVNPVLFNNLATSIAWQDGPDSPAQGLDGYWFNVAGHGGDDFELTDASGFDVIMDIRFSADWLDGQSEELGAANGLKVTKTGKVPMAANWAFVYVRMGDRDTAANQFEGAPSLKLTPTIVPPSAVQGLAATSGPGTVALTWAAPLNDGGELTGYKVLRDGADLATVTVPGYVDTPGDLANHVYTVLAFNSAGNGAPSAISAAAGAAAPAVSITSPADGAIGVSPASTISGSYNASSGGNGGGGTSAFDNTHYFAVLNLNSVCGDPLGYGDHVIINKLTDHAVNVLGMPKANIHIYNEKGVALTSSIDAANYNKLTSEWKTGAVFDGKARWDVVEPALRAVAIQAAAGESAGGAPARIFFIESSHGLQASVVLGDGATDSMFCLDDVDVSSTMLGDLLNDIDRSVAGNATNHTEIEWSINIDCSFCGGFVDSPLPAPGVTAAHTAGVVGPNRVVEVGCTWVTECFGNPAVTYDYMFNECTFTGKADGYGPLVETIYGTGTDGSDVGYEVLVGSASYAEKDGVITLEESYWCAIETAHATFTDPIAIQQMFQISDNLVSDMFGLNGFPIWEADSSIDLGQQDPSVALDLTQLALADVRVADPTGDARTPFSDLVSLEASASLSEIFVDLGVADLTLSSLEFEDEIQYDFFLNGDHYSACYLLGSATLWGWDIPSEDPVTGEPTTGASSGGSVVYDTANGIIHLRVPVSELNDETLPAEVSAMSIYGDCGFGGVLEDDRVPDTGTIQTSEDDDDTTGSGADKVTISLSGPATLSGDATLDAQNATWSFDPAGDLAEGLWTATATLLHDAGSGYVQVGVPATSQFRVGLATDVTPPTAPVVNVSGKTTSSISLSWTTSTDNVGVDHYEVFRGGAPVGTTATTTFTDSGLASSTTYSYVVKAFDAAGNSASSAVKTATTEGISNPVGLVTLSAGSTLLGTADVDTSVNDPVDWEILVDWTALPEGTTQLRADYDDGEGLTASHTINVVVTRSVEITVTSPTAGADVMPTFSAAGTVEGAGGPQGIDASGYMFADGTLNKYHPGYALATQTNVLSTLEAALKNAPGFLGVAPDLEGALVLHAYFTGAAPAAPNVALPEGWTLQLTGDVELQRAALKYPADFRVREGPPAPATAQKLGPGSHLLQTMPGGTFGCTANFVWKDTQGKYYLGAAGHCFLPADKTSTHGSGKDYDRNLTTVKVCVSNCQFGGQMGFLISGNLVTLGKVAYARQTTNGVDVGHDFGIVEIPVSLYDQVRTELPVWNGPTVSGSLSLGEPALLYGNAAGFGEAYPTMARGGFGSVFQSTTSWSAVLPSFQGDSGSSLVSAKTTDPAGTIVEGYEAVGTLTHLSGAGPVVGTTMPRSIAMAAEAGLTISVQLQGAVIAPPVGTVPEAPTLNTLTPGTTSMGLAWTAPTNDGNSVITNYSIRYGTSPGVYTGTKNVSAGTSATITGLAPATQYYFVVKAVNAVGASNASNELNAFTQVAQTVPGAPLALQAFADDGKVVLTWDAPASDGGSPVTSYTVSYTGGPSGSLATGNVNQATVNGLTNGVEYTFTVRATNAVGTGPASNAATATPIGTTPPTFTVEVRGDSAGVEAFAWAPADSFDGSSWSHEFVNAPGGAFTVTARLLRDGIEVRSDSVAVHVLSAPELSAPPTVSGNERQAVQFTATATDADGPAGLTFSLVSAPQGATIGAASGAFSWTPDYGQDGTHIVAVKVTDPEGLSDTASVEITIGLANKPPVMGPVSNQAVGEGETLSFTLTATDRENDALTFSSNDMPAGATLDGTTGAFSWTPAFGTEGHYPVTFRVTDGVSEDSESIVITVGNVNRPPVLDSIGPQMFTENTLATGTVTGSDPDGDVLTFSATGLPLGAVLTPAGVFTWTPTFTQAGTYEITVTVSDGELTASELVTITVANVDRAPVLATITPRQVLQLSTIRVPLVASDPDVGDIITWELNGPAGAAIQPGANGFATLAWTPTLSDLGPRSLTVVARSGPDGLIASKSFVITVNFNTSFIATHHSSSYVSGSPGQVVTITTNITNTGPQTDSFALSLGMSALWKHSSLPSSITLAPGETRLVSVDVTFPMNLAVSYATVTTTSQGNTSASVATRFRLDIPVQIRLDALGHLTNVIDVPAGIVHISHLDGTPAVGALVTVTQMHVRLGGPTSTQQNGTTDANGNFAFDLSGDPKSMIPGKHQLVIVARKPGGFETNHMTTYQVGTTLV